jgi:hypothetical protein
MHPHRFRQTVISARSSAARRIYSFDNNELEVANAVKWAIESANKIHCVHRGAELLAEATPATARRLSEISNHIANSLRTLLARFTARISRFAYIEAG